MLVTEKYIIRSIGSTVTITNYPHIISRMSSPARFLQLRYSSLQRTAVIFIERTYLSLGE